MGSSTMSGRLWYPQLDVYDCIRRMGALLMVYSIPPGLERLYISDFYLTNPPLLHLSRMTRSVRFAFQEMKIPHPKKTFLTYPAPQLLFKKMEPVQREAIRAMTGKGLLTIHQFQRGFAELTPVGRTTFMPILADKLTVEETAVIRFLTSMFPAGEEPGILGLRQRTGLRRPV